MFSAQQHTSTDRDALLARCTVHSRPEIIGLLRSIQKRKLLVNLDLPASRQIIVTSVIAIDDVNHTLILDRARGDALNHKLLSGSGAELATQIDGITITFATGQVSLCEYGKLPALRMALPKSLIRLQRREHFRVPLSAARPVKCILPAVLDADPALIVTHIVDIGCGGVALAEAGGHLGTETNRVLPGCRLLLPENDPITVSLDIRNSARVRLPNGTFHTRLGCQFIEFPNNMIPVLQRFVMNIERRRKGL